MPTGAGNGAQLEQEAEKCSSGAKGAIWLDSCERESQCVLEVSHHIEQVPADGGRRLKGKAETQ